MSNKQSQQKQQQQQQQQQLESLDERLNKSVNTEKKWNNFRVDVLLPLLRRSNNDDNDNNNRRNGFPTIDEPVDENEREYTFDRVYPASMSIGNRSSLVCIAMMFHNEMVHLGSSSSSSSSSLSSSTTMANEFDESYGMKTFFSMVRPIDARWNDTRERLWLSGVTFPFTHDLIDHLTTIDEQRAYKWIDWGTNGRTNNGTIENREQWRKVFAPLTYHRWLVPNSVLNAWTFSIDPNVAYTLNWYRFYLSRIATYKEIVTKYATQLQRQHDLNRKKTAMTNAFVRRNQEMKRSLRMKPTPPRQRAQNYDRFLVALNKLYDDFTKQI